MKGNEPGPAPAAGRYAERRPIVGGLIVLGIGLFLLFGQHVPDAGQWIPLFIGLIFLGAFVVRREYGFLVAGSILSGVGAGIVLAGAAANALSGAVFMLSMAAGFVSIWVVATLLRIPGNHWWPFIPGGILALVGVIQLADADVDEVLRW
jgi:hypothetical protein